MANFSSYGCAKVLLLSDAGTVRLRLQCNPGKREIHERDDRRRDKASGHTGCTGPPLDSLHGRRSTSRQLINTSTIVWAIRVLVASRFDLVLLLIRSLFLRSSWSCLLRAINQTVCDLFYFA